MKTNLLTKTRDLIQAEKRPSFLKALDLYAIEDGILIGVTGSLGYGFQLNGKDVLLQSDGEMDDFERRLQRLINTLPEHVTLHFVVRSAKGDEEALKEYADSIEVKNHLTDQFVQTKLAAYRKKPFRKRDVFLFVVLHPEGKKSRSSFMPDLAVAFGKKAYRASEAEFEQLKERLLSVSNEIKQGLLDLGFDIKALKDRELLHYLYKLLNPSFSEDFPLTREDEEPDPLLEPEPLSLRSKLLLHPPYLDYQYFYLDGFFHRALNLLRLPESTNLKSIKKFEQALGQDYFFTLTLEVPDQEKEKAGIKRQGNLAIAKNFYSRTKDHEAIAKAGQTDELLSEIAESSGKLFYTSLSVVVRGRTQEAVRRRSQEVLRAFRDFEDAYGIEDHMNHDRLFLSLLPLQGDENPLSYLVRSEVVPHLLPLQASWRGTEKIGLLLKTYRDEPLRIDLFDSKLQAKHACMLGTTGSGKSFFTNHLLLHFLMESLEHEVIVIDLGGSYRKLAGVLKGSYLEVECSERFALNPFPDKKVLFPDRGEADATFLQFLKELLQKMIAPTRVWSASEKMILERSVCKVYENLGQEQAPLLGDVENCLRNFDLGDEEDKKKAYQFSKELALFTHGEYGKILNRKGVFDFGARFGVFDLRKISQYPELQEILLLIIPFALKRKFENLNIKKILVLDECWHLLKENQGTNLIETFYRTARKMNAAVLSISQNPEDFLEAKIAGVIVNNSPIKYMLRLKKGHEKLSLFGLNDNEIQAARELEVKPGRHSEIFIKFDEHGVIAKLEPSAFEYWISTTDALDLIEERKLRQEKPQATHLEILETLAQRFPNGVKKVTGVESV